MGVVVGGRVADDDGRVPDDVYIALGVSAIHTTVRGCRGRLVWGGVAESMALCVDGWVVWVAKPTQILQPRLNLSRS